MRYRLRLAPNARRDFARIMAYYDNQVPEQTERLIGDFFATLRRVRKHPLLRREDRPGARHESLTDFRYHVWYRMFDGSDLIEVFAVLHHHQDRAEIDERLR
jgi:plasmid stabilization system protein ParE